MVFNFAAIQMIPLSIFALIFNAKSLIVFLLESIYLKKWPRKLHLFLSFLSFVGVFLLIAPFDFLRPNQKSKIMKIDLTYIIGCFFALLGSTGVALNDIYWNYKGILSIQFLK